MATIVAILCTPSVFTQSRPNRRKENEIMDLRTTYMGFELSCPLVASASPLNSDVDNVKRLEDAGAAAVVMPSLFEEQIKHEAQQLEYFLEYGAERFAESLTYYPQIYEFKAEPEEYLERIAILKQAVQIPVIASLNGVSAGGWTDFASKMAQAGADALELNIYFLPTNPAVNGRAIEEAHLTIVKKVVDTVSIPVAVKLSPFFSSIAAMAHQLAGAGAKGLVLFNRFYQPDIDIESLEVTPRLALSRREENRLPMRWIAILHGRMEASLAASTGIHTGEDVAKMLLAGADVTMMTSALLMNGIDHLKKVRQDLVEIMDSKGYESVCQMRGATSQKNCPEPAAFERANYIKTLGSYKASGTLE
jgi:dihydroorotate dehydrogenase (fumarate)